VKTRDRLKGQESLPRRPHTIISIGVENIRGLPLRQGKN
ncbi:unnamed protein product, partial [Larinioides sclopetarius]